MDQLPGGGWLLGDSGYPLRPWLMTPFLTPQAGQQEKYNASHIKTRNCVERAFGVLGNTSLLSSLYFFNLTFSRDCTSNGTTSLPHPMMMSLQYRKGRIRYRTPKSKIISNSFFYKIIFKTSLTHLQMGHTNSCKNMQNSLKKYKIMFGT